MKGQGGSNRWPFISILCYDSVLPDLVPLCRLGSLEADAETEISTQEVS